MCNTIDCLWKERKKERRNIRITCPNKKDLDISLPSMHRSSLVVPFLELHSGLGWLRLLASSPLNPKHLHEPPNRYTRSQVQTRSSIGMAGCSAQPSQPKERKREFPHSKPVDMQGLVHAGVFVFLSSSRLLIPELT